MSGGLDSRTSSEAGARASITPKASEARKSACRGVPVADDGGRSASCGLRNRAETGSWSSAAPDPGARTVSPPRPEATK